MIVEKSEKAKGKKKMEYVDVSSKDGSEEEDGEASSEFHLWCTISFWRWLVSLIIENTAKAFTNARKLPFLGIMEQSEVYLPSKFLSWASFKSTLSILKDSLCDPSVLEGERSMLLYFSQALCIEKFVMQ